MLWLLKNPKSGFQILNLDFPIERRQNNYKASACILLVFRSEIIIFIPAIWSSESCDSAWNKKGWSLYQVHVLWLYSIILIKQRESCKSEFLKGKQLETMLHSAVTEFLACVQTSSLPQEKSGAETTSPLPIFPEGGGTTVHRLQNLYGSV